MSNLEELALNIINDKRSSFVDGTQINDEILVRVPRLRKFTFYISTESKRNHVVRYLSNEDVQRTFTNIGYQQVCCYLNRICSSVICHVFSLPFAFDYLEYIGNTFPPIDYSHVIELAVHDMVPFEHEFFIRIARFFPLLKRLRVINFRSQSQISRELNSYDNQLYSVVEYPHLISVSLSNAYCDYIDQFLNERKTHLPRLTELKVEYDQLRFVTENFTRETTRRNCARVKQLIVNKILVHSKDFYDYFPLL
jgi:hypothetical protein